MKHLQTNIINDILEITNNAASNALQAVNTQLVIRNWLIGKRIDEEILSTRSKDYGKKLIKKLANNLSKFHKGFSQENLYKYLKFYKIYKALIFTSTFDMPSKILSAVSTNSFLPWSFYELLIRVKNENERKWYEQETKTNGWSYRILQRNIKTDMYHRVISNQLSGNSKQLVNIENNNYLKSLMILEFLGLKKGDQYKESDLQKALEINMSKFLLELGKGYAFVGKQVHLKTNNNDYYIDLVFYNTILKRYLLIDLKVGKIKHQDIGQMLMYLNLFDQQNNIDEASKSIGMILSSDLNSDIVHYLMDKTKDNVLASKYLTYLPTKEEIRREIEKIYK